MRNFDLCLALAPKHNNFGTERIIADGRMAEMAEWQNGRIMAEKNQEKK